MSDKDKGLSLGAWAADELTGQRGYVVAIKHTLGAGDEVCLEWTANNGAPHRVWYPAGRVLVIE